MNNLLSYCGLFDAKIRVSDKDLPVPRKPRFDQGRVLEFPKFCNDQQTRQAGIMEEPKLPLCTDTQHGSFNLPFKTLQELPFKKL